LDFLKNKHKHIAFHLAFWLAYLCYTGVDDGSHHHDALSFSLGPSDITGMLIAMLVVYANLWFLMPRFYSNKSTGAIFSPSYGFRWPAGSSDGRLAQKHPEDRQPFKRDAICQLQSLMLFR